MSLTKLKKRSYRKLRIRKKCFGTKDRPRLSVYRSLRYVYAQLIDDLKGHTLVQASSLETKAKAGNKKAAETVGAAIAERAKGLGIKKVTFDRSGFLYHGVVAHLAEAARKGGLEF